MRNNIYDVTRNVYGNEASNMQPIAFSYVPASKRGNSEETIQNTASRNGENRPNHGNQIFRSLANQNG